MPNTDIEAPLVSVILSYYNGAEYLQTYLHNVYTQSISHRIELVFVGCLLNEAEKEIINDYSYKMEIKKIYLDELKTQSECWNIGIKESSADFCCIWNVDDLRTEKSIENQYNKMISDDTLGATFGMFIISRKFGDNFGQLIDHSSYGRKEYNRSFLLGPFFMFRKSLCQTIGHFDEQLKSGADFDFAIRLSANSKIEMIPVIDGYFLDAQKGLSTRGDNRQPTERTLVELRYGIFDKIDPRFIPLTKTYILDHIKQFGELKLVSELIPNFEEFKKQNGKP